MMKLAVTVNAWLDEELMYAQQLGANQAIAQLTPGEAGPASWEKPKLAALRNRVEKAGLELLGLDCAQVLLKHTSFGEADLTQKSQFFCELITNAGEAGIDLIAYPWGDPQQNWEDLASFLDRVLPAAEAAGVRLAGSFHPGSAHGEGYLQTCERFLDLWPSILHGLDFNPDLLSQNGAVQLRILLRKPGIRERLFLITPGRVLPVQPSGDLREETIMSTADLYTLLEMFHQAGSPASVRAGCQPGISGSPDLDYQELAYASGTLRGILQSLARTG
jgi:hypothetical protein